LEDTFAINFSEYVKIVVMCIVRPCSLVGAFPEDRGSMFETSKMLVAADTVTEPATLQS
jgi:hypothetical protein